MQHTIDRRTPATAKADTIRLARFEDLLRDEQMNQVDLPCPLACLPRRYPMSRRSAERLRRYPGVYQEDSPSPATDPSMPTADEATASSPKASVSDADVVRLARRSAIRMRPNPRVYQEDGPSPTADPSTPTVDEATASSPKASVSDASAVRLARRSAKRMRPNPRVYQKDTPSPAANPSTLIVDVATGSSRKASIWDAHAVRLARRSAKRMRHNPHVYQEDPPSPAADSSTATVVEATASSPKASVSDADTVRLARSMALTQLVELTPSEATTAGPLPKAMEGPKPPAASYDSWGLCLWI